MIGRVVTLQLKLRKMENFENPTTSSTTAAANQVRRKNNFSIENILSRPDNNTLDYRENREVKIVKFMRQNPFQNNHVLFNHNNFINHNSSNSVREVRKVCDDEIKVEEEIIDETHSEIASDDGNSNSGNCKQFFLSKNTTM